MPGAYQIDPATGDFVIIDGQVAMTDEITPELYDAIQINRGAFIGNPRVGSRVHLAITGIPSADPASDVVAAALESLEPLETSGLLEIEAITFESGELIIDVMGLESVRIEP